MTHYLGWTADRVAAAKKRYLAGESATEIAKALGGGLTRNGVIGKADRMGWSANYRQKPTSTGIRRPVAGPSHRKPPKPGQQNRPGAVFGAVSVLNPEETEKKRAAFAEAGAKINARFDAPANDDAIPLMERGRFQCSWPVGSPARPAEQLCCGQPVPEGANPSVETYCAQHARAAVSRVLVGAKPDAKVYERSMRRFA